MSTEEFAIIALIVSNVFFLFIIWIMHIRIRQLIGDVNELGQRMEFSDNEIEVLAEAVRGINITK
ncbi:hypothetical protein F1737_10980 [Methanoplanus sp. FWC-SCC4]|uniref:Uncharacterized protein n=1 Tax=Methanochimaera problematica TaxID=2609417 RepID=A0AA97FD17_9EURY|nr:hypothetical protein [Methanoplanus sp. FWC-SCC4]WOF17165.1 hypothetical protein F1737_10980 [Methanoplanus sp. FWC-SCC4]